MLSVSLHANRIVAGDRVALFGFSRGAFTARALAGMLHCVSLVGFLQHDIKFRISAGWSASST